MKLIAIDTSTEYLSLGISDGEEVLFAKSFFLERRHSTDLLPILEKTLKKLRLSIQEIDGFVIGLGPGSFTGLRVGLSMVKAMAASLRKPVAGVPTLEVLAEAVPGDGPQIAPLIDAKRQQVYAALYERKGEKLLKKVKEEVIPPEDFLRTVEGKTLFVGGGTALYRDMIQKRLGKNALFTDRAHDIPNPKTLLKLGRVRFAQKRFENVNTLVPLYLYPKDCMIKKK